MTETDTENKILPFNNLFLNSGAVNGRNEWWMYVTGVFSAMLGYFLFQIIIQVPLLAIALSRGITVEEITSNPQIMFDPDRLDINKNFLLAMLFGMFVFAFLGLYLAVTKLHRKPFISIVTAFEKIRFSRVFFAFGVWGFLITASTLLSYYMNKEEVTVQFNPQQFFLLLVTAVILMPIQTSTEEFLFRGYMVQGLALLFRNGFVPVLLTSLLFGFVHMSNPEAKTYGWMIMLPYYTAFGLFLGILTLLDEGLELALGIHCANNLISSLLVTSPHGVIKTDAIFLVKSDEPASEIILWSFLALITFLIFWLKYRWKNFNLIFR